MSVCIITGASSGLGYEIALQLASKKHKLILAGRDRERLKETAKKCLALGARLADIFQGDLGMPAACQYLISDLIASTIHQHRRIDILILCAGLNSHFRFSELKDVSVFDKLMQVNFYSNVVLTQQALSHLRVSKGRILVISSMSGKFGLQERSAYCASKFALTGFFEALRMEESNITIHMVFPGSLDTPMRNNSIQPETTAKSEKAPMTRANKNPSPAKIEQPAEKPKDSPKDCAKYLLKEFEAKTLDIYYPKKAFYAVALAPTFPNYIRNKLKNASKL